MPALHQIPVRRVCHNLEASKSQGTLLGSQAMMVPVGWLPG
jgi:hypothetical protein